MYVFYQKPDLEFQTLRSLGYTGTLGDMQRAYLRSLFGTDKSLADALHQYSLAQKVTLVPESGEVTLPAAQSYTMTLTYDDGSTKVFPAVVPPHDRQWRVPAAPSGRTLVVVTAERDSLCVQMDTLLPYMRIVYAGHQWNGTSLPNLYGPLASASEGDLLPLALDPVYDPDNQWLDIAENNGLQVTLSQPALIEDMLIIGCFVPDVTTIDNSSDTAFCMSGSTNFPRFTLGSGSATVWDGRARLRYDSGSSDIDVNNSAGITDPSPTIIMAVDTENTGTNDPAKTETITATTWIDGGSTLTGTNTIPSTGYTIDNIFMGLNLFGFPMGLSLKELWAISGPVGETGGLTPAQKTLAANLMAERCGVVTV